VRYFRTIAAGLVLCGMTAAGYSAGWAAQAAPTGAWRTTNDCFLVAFLLTEGGRAQALYGTGEHDDNASWNWDGSTLKIASAAFSLDHFDGHLAGDRLEADYVWHDLDKDELTRQACVFERFTPGI
jgi:hypothetical protein